MLTKHLAGDSFYKACKSAHVVEVGRARGDSSVVCLHDIRELYVCLDDGEAIWAREACEKFRDCDGV